jgi:hypothetical protein
MSMYGQSTVIDNKNIKQPDKTGKKNEIGIGAGFITGYGISYRRWLSGKNGLMLNFAPFYDENNQEKFTSIDIGVTYIHKITQYNQCNFVLYSGVHMYSSWDEYLSYSNTWTDKTYEKNYTLGIGPGVIYENNSFSFDLLFGYRFIYKQNASTGIGLYPSIEIGGHFKY